MASNSISKTETSNDNINIASAITIYPKQTYSIGGREIPFSTFDAFMARFNNRFTSETELTLTEIIQNKVFQREAGTTSSNITISGDGYAVMVQGQVLLDADDSVVVDWTNIGSGSTGTWSGTISVPQGGPYYIKVRSAAIPATEVTGSTTWNVGIVVMAYGQSNMDFFFSLANSPPSASAGTFIFNGTTWATTPAADGVREFMNALRAATGVPCGIMNRAVSGVNLDYLAPGGAGYTAASTRIIDSGGDIEMILWDHGEGDANTTNPFKETYLQTFDEMHNGFATLVGRTRATLPILIGSIGTTTAGGGTNDISWQTIKDALYEASKIQIGVYFSHSNADAVRTDEYHYNAVSQGRQGKRFANTALKVLGLASSESHFDILSGAIIDATTTTVDVAHGPGTDITVGSEGWEVSSDNGGSWATATPSRSDANTISLSHSSAATNNARCIRYQYGKNAYVGVGGTPAGVVDNSSLSLPLTYSSVIFRPTPLTTIPIPDFVSRGGGFANVTTSTSTYRPIGYAGVRRMLVIGLGGSLTNVSSVVVTPNVGTAKTCTQVIKNSSTGIYQALLDVDSNAATYVTVVVNYSSMTFNETHLGVWAVPHSQLSSTTATGSGGNTTTGTSVSTTLLTPAGGFTVAVTYTDVFFGAPTQAVTFSGDETYNHDSLTRVGNAKLTTFGLAHNNTSRASSSITANYVVSGACGITAASWF